MVMLGAYVTTTKVVRKESVIKGLKELFKSKINLFETDVRAFEDGIKFADRQRVNSIAWLRHSPDQAYSLGPWFPPLMEKHKKPRLRYTSFLTSGRLSQSRKVENGMAKARQRKTTERKRRSPRVAKSPPHGGKPESKPEGKPESATEPKSGAYEKVVYVGQKPVKNYVIACLTSFSVGSTKIIVKARGRAICKAIDTVELLRRSFMKNVELRGISIGTEQVAREGDRKANVSAIEITLAKT
jgi:DNA-binding protein